jgi:hypothetical protein
VPVDAQVFGVDWESTLENLGLYFDDERGPLRITYTEEDRDYDMSLDDILGDDSGDPGNDS